MLEMKSAKEPAPNYNTSVEHVRGKIKDAIVGVDHATGQSAVNPSPAQPDGTPMKRRSVIQRSSIGCFV